MKQVIVMRTDLNMRKGKMVAQGAHASERLTAKYMVHSKIKPKNFEKHFEEWERTGTKKICVGVDSLEALIDLTTKAFDNHLPLEVVKDAGHTEFHGVPTITCVAIGPAPDEEIDKLTGELKLI